MDVAGAWSTTAGGFSEVNLAQQGTSLDACAPGFGATASGTIDSGSGAFTLEFDLARLAQFGVYLCDLHWNGTFAPDGQSFTGTQTISVFVPGPPMQAHCDPPQTTPISGTRLGPATACCGDGVPDPGEQCDDGSSQVGCCSSTCQFVASGTSCNADDGNLCTTESCDGAGTCQHVNNTFSCNAGACASGGLCTNGQCTPTGFRPAGWFCDADSNICTADGCDGAGHCVVGPPPFCGSCSACVNPYGCRFDRRTDCHEGGPRSRIVLERGTSAADDAIGWHWQEGTGQTTPADFGDPLGGTEYQLCVFMHDPNFNDTLLLDRATAPAGGSCGGRPCWTPRPQGFRYRDRERTPAGLDLLALRARSGGRSTIRLKGAGGNLPFFGSELPAIRDVTVQLSAKGGGATACWSTTFDTPGTSTPARWDARLP